MSEAWFSGIPQACHAAAVVVLAAPVLAALGAFAALATNCTVEVERIDQDK